ncbi:MAG TPA: DNA primase [Actinomycetota bacterium]|nr:DNA primase [Actinomycetota bacterium]
MSGGTGKGRIADADLDLLRDKASIVEVAADYMKVRQAGRIFKALCPFHSEKTPSFSIDPAKGVFYCFGCQKGGDVITLVRELESLDFVEAVEHLARKTGITLHYEQLSAAERDRSKTRNRLIDAHREAVAYYHALLKSSAGAKKARQYLASRKLKPETLERFQVGWAEANWDGLTKHLKTRGFRDDELTTGGLSLRTERGGLIDRFRGRVMFPIFDVTGEPRAFGARKLLDDDDGPKYLNSAESPIYKKGTILYALNWGKAEIVKADVAIVVEGYTDVIALHQEGIPLAVATCGTALGVEHFQSLSRFTKNVVIALDGDAAGQSAAERAVERAYLDAQQRDMSLRVLTLPAGSDPAEHVVARGGEEFRRTLQDSVPVVEFRLRARLQGLDLSEPEGRSRGLRACLPVLAQVADQVVLRDYTRWVADRCGLDYDIVFLEVRKALRGSSTPGPAGIKQASSQVTKEREALKLALQFPDLVEEHLERLDPDDFQVPSHRSAWEQIRRGDTDPSHAPEDGVRALMTRLAVEPVEGVPDGEPGDRLIDEIFTRLEEFAVTRQINEVRSRLEKLNPVNDPPSYDALFKELVALEAARRRMTIDEPAGA